MMVVGGRDRFFLDLGPTVAPLLFAVVGVEILRRGDLLPLSPILVEVSLFTFDPSPAININIPNKVLI